MSMSIIIAVVVVVILIGAVGTIMVGIKPPEAKYGSATRSNLTRLTWFYVFSAIILLGVFVYVFG
ncbi:MAG: hypothetical protein ACM32O_10660 [Clostridia bacterium]